MLLQTPDLLHSARSGLLATSHGCAVGMPTPQRSTPAPPTLLPPLRPPCYPRPSQDARKGVLFEGFPPVLQLQLKRFEYDFMKDMMIKVGGVRW